MKKTLITATIILENGQIVLTEKPSYDGLSGVKTGANGRETNRICLRRSRLILLNSYY